MNTKEVKLPKAYIYSVEGVLNEDGVEKRFSVPSLSRDINDDFDADSIAHSAALSFFLDHEDYRSEEFWPLKFRFQTKDTPVELIVELSFSPCFLTKQKDIVQIKTNGESLNQTVQEDANELEAPKKVRKPRVTKQKVSQELIDTLLTYEGYLTLVDKPTNNFKISYGACLTSLDHLEELLTSLKAITTVYEEFVKIKWCGQDYVLRISEDFYEAITPDEVFDPTIPEDGILINVKDYL